MKAISFCLFFMKKFVEASLRFSCTMFGWKTSDFSNIITITQLKKRGFELYTIVFYSKIYIFVNIYYSLIIFWDFKLIFKGK